MNKNGMAPQKNVEGCSMRGALNMPLCLYVVVEMTIIFIKRNMITLDYYIFIL